jgi:hypothetical protein
MNYAPFCRKQLDALWCDGSAGCLPGYNGAVLSCGCTQSKRPLQRFLAVRCKRGRGARPEVVLSMRTVLSFSSQLKAGKGRALTAMDFSNVRRLIVAVLRVCSFERT